MRLVINRFRNKSIKITFIVNKLKHNTLIKITKISIKAI